MVGDGMCLKEAFDFFVRELKYNMEGEMVGIVCIYSYDDKCLCQLEFLIIL